MIWRATYADIPQIVEWAKQQYQPDLIGGDVNEDFFSEWLAEAVSNDNIWIGVSETGSFGLMLAPFFVNGRPILQELWVLNTGGGPASLNEILDGMEDCAREVKATAGHAILQVRALVEQRGEALARLMKRRGFRRSGIELVKEF